MHHRIVLAIMEIMLLVNAMENKHVPSTIIFNNVRNFLWANKLIVNLQVKVSTSIIRVFQVNSKERKRKSFYGGYLDFFSSQLPRVDICSLQSLHGLTEGFIHTPNYPNNYPNSRTCSKTVPSPDAGHRYDPFHPHFNSIKFHLD